MDRVIKLCLVSDTVLPPSFLKKIAETHILTFHSLSFKTLDFLSQNTFDSCLIFAKGSSGLFLKKFLKNLQVKSPPLPVFLWLTKSTSVERAYYLGLGVKDCFSGSLCGEEFVLKMNTFSEKNPFLSSKSSPFTCGKFSFCFISKKALYTDKEIFLNKKETLLLDCLLSQAERIIPRDFLHDFVWKNDDLPASNVLETYISRLRRKIEKPCQIQLIQTIWGVGYKIKKAPIPGGL